MTTHAHARRRVLGRLLDLARGHGPVPALPGYGDGPEIVRFWNEWTAGPDPAYGAYDEDMAPGSYDHPTWIGEPGSGRPEHPPWATAPQPALAGPGRLGAFYAAADLREQRAGLAAEYESWYGWDLTAMDNPVTRTRPYAPEPEPEPDPAPEPVSYPPLDLHADLGLCVIFRDTVRDQFTRQERARGHRHDGPWLQVYADVFEQRTAPAPAFQSWSTP